MDAKRIEIEIERADGEITRLESALAATRQWRSDLTTSLSVLRKLDGEVEPSGTKVHTLADIPAGSPGVVLANQRVVKRGRRSETNARAGQALVEILTERGAHLKPLEAVKLLRERYGLLVGNGAPGRETSDLSAALGNDKFPPLYVTRSQGWGLTTWGDQLPADEHAYAKEDDADPRNPDIEYENAIMNDAEAKAEEARIKDEELERLLGDIP